VGALRKSGTSGRPIATISKPGGKLRVRSTLADSEKGFLEDNDIVVIDESDDMWFGNFDGQPSIYIPNNYPQT
jgi:hypothetical protein